MSEQLQEEQQAPQVSGLGLELKRGREAKGYTVERIADELHLRPSIVIAMEEENYALLPGDIFLKGYIRSYARLVGLSEDEIVQLLDLHLSREADIEAHSKHVKGKEKRKKHSKYAVVLLLVAIILGVFFYFWSEKLGNGKADLFQSGSELEASAIETSDANAPENSDDTLTESNGSNRGVSLETNTPTTNERSDAVMEEQTEQNSNSDSVEKETEESEINLPEEQAVIESVNLSTGSTVERDSEAVTVHDSVSDVSTDVSEDTAVEVSTATTPAVKATNTTTAIEGAVVINEGKAPKELNSEAIEAEVVASEAVEPVIVDSPQDILVTPPLEQGSIKVVFSGECWFTLKNGEGKTVIADLKKAGDEINYSGALPFSVVVGAVSEVTMHFDDTPIDFSTVRVRNNRASLELTH